MAVDNTIHCDFNLERKGYSFSKIQRNMRKKEKFES